MAEAALRRTLLVRGVVQGVGFRPYVYRLATEHLLGGWVRNDGQGVTICVEGPQRSIDDFCWQLSKQLPELSKDAWCRQNST